MCVCVCVCVCVWWGGGGGCRYLLLFISSAGMAPSCVILPTFRVYRCKLCLKRISKLILKNESLHAVMIYIARHSKVGSQEGEFEAIYRA